MAIDEAAKTLADPSSEAVTRPRVAKTSSGLEMARTALADPSSAPARVDVAPAPLEETPSGPRYADRSILGEGGMGEVRLCRDARIGRDVAMKVIRPGSGSRSDLRARFEREARVQGQLEHPSIVPVYDLGIDADGAAFFTMKRIRGKTFDEIVQGLRDGDVEIAAQYNLRKLLVAFAQVCNALAFAHARGVLHRDLKPANVMLGDFGEVYVLDWGLAKLVEPTADDAPVSRRVSEIDAPPIGSIQDARALAAAATATGAIMGTPGYMAPEQVRGDDAIDARIDVYALGAILFELLALEPMHQRTSPEALLVSTIKGIDARPSLRAPDREIPPELEAIVLRATALERDDRHPTARALLEDVERYLDGDRDLARRRELAAMHAERARVAADALCTSKDPANARREAIREVSRALAFDPTHAEATATMLRLLVEVPKEVPAEVEREIDDNLAARRRSSERVGSYGYLSLLSIGVLVLCMGLRSVPWFVASMMCVVLAFALTWLAGAGRLGDDRPWAPIVFVISTIAMASASLLFGPFVMLPGMVATNTLFYVMEHPRGVRRFSFLVGAALAMIVPLALEWTGVLPPSYAFRDGTIVLLPRLASFPAGFATLGVLVASSLGIALLPPLLVARVSDEARNADRRVFLHLWHLRQFIPDEARGAAKMSDAPPPKHACLIDEAAWLARRGA
jgi:serine/threonine-protein kinase